MTLIGKIEHILKEYSKCKLPSDWEKGYVSCLRTTLDILKSYNEWTPTVDRLPDIWEDVCVKLNDSHNGHYQICELMENGQWLGQYGEIYEKGEVIAWKYFELFEGETV